MSGCVEASDGATMGEVVMVTGLIQRRRNAKVITVEITDCDVTQRGCEIKTSNPRDTQSRGALPTATTIIWCRVYSMHLRPALRIRLFDPRQQILHHCLRL